MLQTLNQYSFIVALPLFFVALAALLPIARWKIRLPLYATVAAVVLAAFFALRPGSSSVASTAEIDSALAAGQPVFVELFSNTCTLCLASEPLVKSLKGEVDDAATVLRLQVQDPVVAPFMAEYKAYSVPTFIVFDRRGQEVWRQSGKILNKGAALEALAIDG